MPAAPGRIFWSMMPPARPPAILSAIAGWSPAASPAPMAGGPSCSNRRRESLRCGSMKTRTPTALARCKLTAILQTGRASGGVKVSYPLVWASTTNVAPYLGLYGDYYFSRDDAAIVGLTTVPLLQGWSGRATGGVAMTFGHGAISAGGEYGGIGSDLHIWTWRARGTVAF